MAPTGPDLPGDESGAATAPTGNRPLVAEGLEVSALLPELVLEEVPAKEVEVLHGGLLGEVWAQDPFIAGDAGSRGSRD